MNLNSSVQINSKNWRKNQSDSSLRSRYSLVGKKKKKKIETKTPIKVDYSFRDEMSREDLLELKLGKDTYSQNHQEEYPKQNTSIKPRYIKMYP